LELRALDWGKPEFYSSKHRVIRVASASRKTLAYWRQHSAAETGLTRFKG
jgi:hypothetical protein